ncbi:MAG: hypothetical protein ACYTGH_14855, partial [Planctomycetota bacterium]
MKSPPPILAMLCKQAPIEGDDALLRLVQARFTEAGLKGELHPQHPADLREQLDFLPEGNGHTAHLPRHLNPLVPDDRDLIRAMAEAGEGRLQGMILHDRPEMGVNEEQT